MTTQTPEYYEEILFVFCIEEQIDPSLALVVQLIGTWRQRGIKNLIIAKKLINKIREWHEENRTLPNVLTAKEEEGELPEGAHDYGTAYIYLMSYTPEHERAIIQHLLIDDGRNYGHRFREAINIVDYLIQKNPNH